MFFSSGSNSSDDPENLKAPTLDMLIRLGEGTNVEKLLIIKKLARIGNEKIIHRLLEVIRPGEREIIEEVATEIDRKVNLKKPDKILLIEILGALTGISLIGPNDIIAVTKEKIL